MPAAFARASISDSSEDPDEDRRPKIQSIGDFMAIA